MRRARAAGLSRCRRSASSRTLPVARTVMTPAVSIRDAVVVFGQNRAVDGVSVTMPERHCFGLVGESGSGKTTLMRAILGLQRLTSGSISFFGAEPAMSGGDVRRRTRIVQAIFQDPAASLSPRRRVGQLLDEVGEVLGDDRE